MTSLRAFCPDDWQVVVKYQYPDMGQDDALKLIDNFNAPTYQGKFHKLKAIDSDRQVVGYVSLIEQAEGVVSAGVEVYAPFRRQGHAYTALLQLFALSKLHDYHTVSAQVRKDNAASLALCDKLGFTVVNEAVSKRGNPVYNLTKSI